jgi:hypothetical protein
MILHKEGTRGRIAILCAREELSDARAKQRNPCLDQRPGFAA